MSNKSNQDSETFFKLEGEKRTRTPYQRALDWTVGPIKKGIFALPRAGLYILEQLANINTQHIQTRPESDRDYKDPPSYDSIKKQ